MALLPLTVESVSPASAGLVQVVLTMADLSRRVLILPETLATIEAVRWSAIALAQLAELDASQMTHPHRKHRRYDPRTAT